jgi:uncharacterized protein (DUF427 family)
MTQTTTIKSLFDGSILASSTKAIHLEGYTYFDKSEVNLDLLTKKDDMYTCPIKRATCDYYYLPQDPNQEICWCYETIPSSLFEHVAGKIGFYGNIKDLTQIEISEE